MPRKTAVKLYDGTTSNGANVMNEVNGVTDSSEAIVQEINKMNPINEAVSALATHLYDNRVHFVPNKATACISMTAEEIATRTPMAIFTKLVMEGRIGITNVTNKSREEGIPVVFADSIQMDQVARGMTYVEHGVFQAWYQQFGAGKRAIALMDLKGDQSRQVIETVGENGYVTYDVRYANPEYNNHGGLIGLRAGAMNPIQQSIFDRVNGYNGWVEAHNSAVLAKVSGEQLSEEAVKLLGKVQENADPNLFVRNNSVHTIKYETVVNKYAIAAWLTLDDNRPAFHIYSPARSLEATIKFIEGRLTKMVYGYQSQLKVLAGIPYVKVDEEVTIA